MGTHPGGGGGEHRVVQGVKTGGQGGGSCGALHNTASVGGCFTHCRQLLSRTALKDCTAALSSSDVSPSLTQTLIVCLTAATKVGGLADKGSVGCPATTA